MKKDFSNLHSNEAGFLIPDYLLSLVLVISSCGILFALCFSLAAVEISQYITWSVSRAYSAAHPNQQAAPKAGRQKFNYLAKKFPLLTGVGADSSWFELRLLDVGNNPAVIGNLEQINQKNSLSGGEARQPWTGVATELDVSLFRRMNLPLIGKLSDDDNVFKYNLKSFILRNPSQEECLMFFKNKYQDGVSRIEGSWNGKAFLTNKQTDYIPVEDNGC